MRKLLFLVLIAVAIVPMQVGAYGVDTHAALTQEIARFFNQHYPKRAFTSAEMKVLMGGAVDEDDGLRMLNHFYDPVHKVGLPGQLASKEWVQNPTKQAGIVNNALALVLSQDDYNSGDYTWRRAIEDYAVGRTERGLEGLGHVLHLIEDLTVPAHVRNDPHPPKGLFGEKIGDDDPYELWSHKFNAYNINIAPFLRDKKPVTGLGSLNKYFDELATYTNSRFFSKDRIYVGDFKLPDLENLSIERRGKIELLSFKDSDGTTIVAWKNTDLLSSDKGPISTDSDIVSQSTWDRLSIKAVQYGAGVVDLFFNEVEKLKNDPKFKPTEQKSLLGQFIDSVGENVGALLEGAPEPQPVVVISITPEPSVEKESVQPAISESIEVLTVIPVPAPAPVVQSALAPMKVVAKKFSGGSGGGGEEEVVEEEVVEPVASEPEPIIVPVSIIDTVAPAPVTDLESVVVLEGAITLRWTAPGDDAAEGTAARYELRQSTGVITEETWLAAEPVSVADTPQRAGEQEEIEISGLAPATIYYFALKTADEVGNTSSLSNVASEKTLPEALNHIVISEVFPDMAGVDTGEFVELYNPTDAAIDVGGYSLQYLSGSAVAFTSVTKKNFVAGATIPAKGFYLIGMSGNAATDMSWSEQLHNTGATIFLVSDQVAIESGDDGQIVDRIAYGTGSGVLSPEGVAAPLPGEGKSIERRSFGDGACTVATGDGEFAGNGCDTGDNLADFEVRAVARPQRAANLFEPRSAPSVVSNESAILSYIVSAAELRFAWLASTDASGSSTGMRYRIIDISNPENPSVLYDGSALVFMKTIDEVGREYRATIQAIDKDGFGSEITELMIDVPSYLRELSFITNPINASGTQTYAVRLAWDAYPFIPIVTDRWHLVVFYYNKDAEKIPFLGQLNTGHNWGMGISMPSAFKTRYANCFGGTFVTNNSASLVLPDSAVRCDSLTGGAKSKSIDFGLLRDGTITLPVLAQTFGGTNPTTGESYVTVAFYAFADGNSLGNDQRLIAIDKTRYYLSE